MAGFPMRPDNRPSLPRIDYRIGTYSDIRADLIRRLNATPELAGWTHREPDDPGIALLEVGAVLGDILTFYLELYANEAYLRTARWRTSVAELVRIVGYRMAPGLGGSGTFALELRAGAPVTVPAGFSLQVELEGADAPATFETLAELVAFPELSRFNLYRPLAEAPLVTGATELWIDSSEPLDIAADDRLLIGAPDPAEPDRLTETQIVVVDDVRALHGATIVQIQGALQGDYPAGAVGYRLGRSFRHFGHSAPAQDVRVGTGGTATATTVDFCRSLTGSTSIGSGTLRALDLPLDSAVDDFAAGRQVICSYVGGCDIFRLSYFWGGASYHASTMQMAANGDTGFVASDAYSTLHDLLDPAPPVTDTVVRTVTRVDAASLRVGSLSGPSTVLGLDRALESGSGASADMRTFAIHEVLSGRLDIHAPPLDRAQSSGNDLYFEGPAAVAASLAGRRIMLVPPGAEATTAIVAAVVVDESGVPGFEGLHKVTLAAPAAYSGFPQMPDDTATVAFGNVVDADQGKTEPEAAIGSGDGRSAFQTFKLPKAPLTYHQAPSQTPPHAPGLEVTVAGRTWTRVESLFGQGPTAEVYVVREDADRNSWVQFGDGGEFGARLPSGVDNVRATARTGAGAHGPLKEGTKVLPGRLDRLQAVQLPGVIAGGSEPEASEIARVAAPGRVQSLGRLVGLSDFEAEALALPGVALASAAWGIAHGVPTVTVTVLMEHGREAEHAAVAEALRTAARERGADRFEIAVVQGRFRSVKLRADVAVASGYDADAVLAATRDALGVDPAPDGLFSVNRRLFGQSEHVTRVAGVIQQVSGVSWARVAGGDKTLRCPPDRVLRLAHVDLAAVSGAPA
jgi:hypothetical protein